MKAHLYTRVLTSSKESPRGFPVLDVRRSSGVVVAVLVPSRIALREHAVRDPREREDVSGVVVRWMDQVDERERRRVPHSDRAVAFREVSAHIVQGAYAGESGRRT